MVAFLALGDPGEDAGEVAPRWAVGERTPPGVRPYVFVVPLAPDGVSARTGTNLKAEDELVNDDTEVT